MPRLPLKSSVIKKLFALSGNECAFPFCKEHIIDKNLTLIGEVCHIEAAEKGGQRFNSSNTDEYNRSFDNLILFCGKHHKITNNVEEYPAPKLKKMKADHESRSSDPKYDLPEHLVPYINNIYMNNESKDNSIQNNAVTQTINTQIGTQNIYNSKKPFINRDRSVNEEFKALIDLAKKNASPPSQAVIDYKNEVNDKIARTIELIPTSLLKFRKDNGRIKADVESYEKATGNYLDECTPEGQEMLRGFLKKNDKEKNDELKKLLIHKGQKDPAIITCDGFLINGNRRKMALEELWVDKNEDPKFEMMRVVILPEDATELDIQKIENRYQLQGEGKSEYHGLNRALTLKRNIEKGFSLEAQLKDNPQYHDLPKKDFTKKVEEYRKKYLEPLECVDRYLELFGRKGLYNTISEREGDREGRWQAFLDYSSFYNSTLTNTAKQLEYKIKDVEVRKIEDALFKIIRKRNLNSKEIESSIGKVHDFIRKAKKYISNEDAKKHLLAISEQVKEDLPEVMKYNKEGVKYDEREIDEKWGRHYQNEILGNLIKAHKIVINQSERDKPLELLEDALKKLNHENMTIENMDSAHYNDAMEISNKISLRIDEIYGQLDKARYKLKQLNKTKKS